MATFKVLLGVFLIALVSKEGAAYDGCPGDWEPLGDFCYWSSWSEEDYGQAREDCQAFDSYMVLPLSEEENVFVNDLLWKLRGKVWLGCDDLDNEGDFVCQDITQSDFRGWKKNEPDNAENTIYDIEQDCMAMGYDGQWIDLRCGKRFYYVCKKAK